MPDRVEKISSWLASGGFATLCAALSYLLKVEEGKPFKWSEFCLHSIISGVFGWIAFQVLAYEGIPADVSCALCGVAGWGGTRLIRLIEVAVKKRIESATGTGNHEEAGK